MDTNAPVHFRCEPHPDHPGWNIYEISEADRYNRAVLGDLIIRAEGVDHCRIRLMPQPRHLNGPGRIHGGLTLGLIDVSFFAALHLLRGVAPESAVTLDVQTQFIGPGHGDRPLDAVAQVLRETRRTAFLRGLVMQEDDLIASYSGIIRKS